MTLTNPIYLWSKVTHSVVDLSSLKTWLMNRCQNIKVQEAASEIFANTSNATSATSFMISIRMFITSSVTLFTTYSSMTMDWKIGIMFPVSSWSWRTLSRVNCLLSPWWNGCTRVAQLSVNCLDGCDKYLQQMPSCLSVRTLFIHSNNWTWM